MKKRLLALLILTLVLMIPANAFASTPSDNFSNNNFVSESLEDYPVIGSAEADFSEGVRIGNTICTITDENGNALPEGTTIDQSKMLLALESAGGIKAIKAYPAYVESNGSITILNSVFYMYKSWLSPQANAYLYPTTDEYNTWTNYCNNNGKVWSHFKLLVTYKLKSDAVEYVSWNNGAPFGNNGTPPSNYVVTLTSYPQVGYIGNGSSQSMTYRTGQNVWSTVGTAWVYNVAQ